MFQNSIIPNELSLYKFFKQLNFDLYLTKLLYGELFYTIKVRLNYLNYTSF